jgi:hypothetical protein
MVCFIGDTTKIYFLEKLCGLQRAKISEIFEISEIWPISAPIFNEKPQPTTLIPKNHQNIPPQRHKAA